MSVISNRHQIVLMDKKSKAMNGQRLVRIIAKAASAPLGDNWVKKESGFYNPHLTASMCVSVPHIELSDVQAQITALLPHIGVMLESVQDSIIGELRKESGTDGINDAEISVAACIAYMESENKGNRVTSEYLAKWFEDTYSLAAAEFIATMCGFSEDCNNWTPDQVVVIETKSRAIRDMFAGFASGKYSPDIPKCKAMIRFCEFIGAESLDVRMVTYRDKAVKIKSEKEKELSVDALGF